MFYSHEQLNTPLGYDNKLSVSSGNHLHYFLPMSHFCNIEVFCYQGTTGDLHPTELLYGHGACARTENPETRVTLQNEIKGRRLRRVIPSPMSAVKTLVEVGKGGCEVGCVMEFGSVLGCRQRLS